MFKFCHAVILNQEKNKISRMEIRKIYQKVVLN